MEKKLLLMKSLLQTGYFAIRNQKGIAVLIGFMACIISFDSLIFGVNYNIQGLNYLLISIICLSIAIFLHQPALNNRLFWWSTLGAIVSGFNILYEPDGWSIMMYFLSHFLVIGSIHVNSFRNYLMVVAQFLINQVLLIVNVPWFFMDKTYWNKTKKINLEKILTIGSIPFAIGILFIIIYSQANMKFYEHFVEPIINFFSNLGNRINEKRIFTFIIGSFFIAPLIFPVVFKSLKLKPLKFQKNIKRTRVKTLYKVKMLDLKKEYHIALISFIILNLLIAVFNITDIIYVWFGTQVRTAAELSQYVHDGTNLTIFSIILGASITLIFFRKNLIFYSGNRLLKLAVFIWIIQNTFLVLSTFIRNFTYVNEYGLTYKRLGVVIFLGLTLIGLFFLYEKILKTHSLHHFINRFLIATFLTLLIFSVLDHNRLIINHAVYLQKENIDTQYLTRISYNHDFLLLKHKDAINSKASQKLVETEPRYNYIKSDILNWNYMTYKNQRVGKRIQIEYNPQNY